MLGCVSPCSAIETPALPVFWIELVNVPMEPKETVPKDHVVASGVLAMTAPRGCMTSITECGVSDAALVVIVRVSANAVGSFGLATVLGIADGVTVMVTLPPIASVAGS